MDESEPRKLTQAHLDHIRECDGVTRVVGQLLGHIGYLDDEITWKNAYYGGHLLPKLLEKTKTRGGPAGGSGWSRNKGKSIRLACRRASDDRG